MDRRDFLKGAAFTAAGAFLSKSMKILHAAEPFLATTTDERYRTFSDGTRVSTIGIGAGHFRFMSADETEYAVRMSMERGVNFMDTAASDEVGVEPIVRALSGQRGKMIMQIHFGAIYPGGRYASTRNPAAIEQGFIRELQKYRTDYADIGMIHYVDTEQDANYIMNGGILAYAQRMQQSGAVRRLGFSSHSPRVSRILMETGVFDTFMFSLNPAYDFVPYQEGLVLSQERSALYQQAQRLGVGISVMKVVGGGRLLNASTSPFGRALTVPQCLQYALDRPGVVSCLIGASSVAEMEQALEYYNSSREERNYAFIGESVRNDGANDGACVYCNHCLPCPVEIDVGAVLKYTDLYKAGDLMAGEHYRKLSRNADDCVECDICEERCPFQVGVVERMREAQRIFTSS